MTITHYEPSMTMLEARNRYFDVNHFGKTGGYDDAWVDFKLGPIPFPFPNTKGRVRAVKVHDMHHILTGYDTDIIGEFEISAWEIGAGCKDFFTAWALNLGGTFSGLVVAPKRTYRAFVRGRRSRSLYGERVEELLEERVSEVRARTGVEEAKNAAATTSDTVLFAASAFAGFVVGSVLAAEGLALLPLGLLTNYLRKRSSVRDQTQGQAAAH